MEPTFDPKVLKGLAILGREDVVDGAAYREFVVLSFAILTRQQGASEELLHSAYTLIHLSSLIILYTTQPPRSSSRLIASCSNKRTRRLPRFCWKLSRPTSPRNKPREMPSLMLVLPN